jgi:hypothetical protein
VFDVGCSLLPVNFSLSCPPWSGFKNTVAGKMAWVDQIARQRLGVRRRAKRDAAFEAIVEPSGVFSPCRALSRIESGVAATAVQNPAECSNRASVPGHIIFKTALALATVVEFSLSCCARQERRFLKMRDWPV